jgi:sulfur transfer protein SufE
MYSSCLKKQDEMKDIFLSCSDEQEKYEKIIDLGKENLPMRDELKTQENKVHGCQSTMYLHSSFKNGKVYFEACSDALISSGLAVILIKVYSGEVPETIIKCPPDYLEDLGVSASLTPSRANGLYSIHLRMKQEALKFLLSEQSKSAS